MVDVVEELTTRPVRALSDGDDAVSASKPCSARSKNRLSPLTWHTSRFDARVQLFLRHGGPQPELQLRGYSDILTYARLILRITSVEHL